MIEQLVEKIEKANEAYRIGKPFMSDPEYDTLIDELRLLDGHHPLLYKVGHTISDDRKSKLPIPMASMDKTKTVDEIYKWCGSKKICNTEEVIITPKYDGLSFCVEETNSGSWDNPRYKAWTRGDGEYGQRSTTHYELIQNKLKTNRNKKTESTLTACIFKYTFGEVMMKKETFLEKYSENPNPRNMIGGLLNSKTPGDTLKDCHYIKYGAVPTEPFAKYFETKKEILDQLNTNQEIGVPHLICSISELSDEMLCDLFHAWSDMFEIDGLIIEINELYRQRELGRETSSNNPCWARAYKHASFEQSAETYVTGISWNISKQGYLKPTVHVQPIKLDGVTISNVTGNNARFIKDLGIGTGAKIIIKRSGMVIPTIVDVIEPIEWKMPNIPDIDWNDNEVELMTLNETDEQRFKQAVSFFEILEADGIREGVIRQLWDAGFNSIEKILRIKPSDMHGLSGFGTRKTATVHTSIWNATREVDLAKLQHATGIFPNLGSKKLKLLVGLENPTLDNIMQIEGFAEKSAKAYLENIEQFNTWFNGVKDIVQLKEVKTEETTDELLNKAFVFSGVRRKDLEEVILSKGGRIASGVSKNITHLVMKELGTGSSKEKKAISIGGIEIITVEQLEEILK